MKKDAQKLQREGLRRNEEKWGTTLIAAGWTVLPSVILERQRALALDAVDINILMHLARYWWFKDRPPFPSKRTIAECMNIDVSTVRRHIQRLEADGLIRRTPRFEGGGGGQLSNSYHFDGLIAAAEPFAREEVDTQRTRRQEDAEKRTRKRPKLRLVQTAQTGDAE